jgi:hypothetical protein
VGVARADGAGARRGRAPAHREPPAAARARVGPRRRRRRRLLPAAVDGRRRPRPFPLLQVKIDFFQIDSRILNVFFGTART